MTNYYYKFDNEELTLEVPDQVYFPREDSELLAKIMREEHVKGKTVLDVGTGSGLLAIIAAKMGAQVTAVDVNPMAISTAKANAKKLKVTITFRVSNMFSELKESYDIIVFNPPYLPENDEDLFSEDKITYAGGSTGRKFIEEFVDHVKSHLNPHGKVMILISSLTSEHRTAELFQEAGFKTKILGRSKIPWEELIVIEARM